jgi:hypothetical protein
MASEIKANKISPATGTAITLGDSGDTFTIPSGATITNSGTASGFGVSNDCVLVKRSTDQTATANTITKVQFDSEIYDSNNWFDSSTNYRFQPDVAGNYLCHTNIAVSSFHHDNLNIAIMFYKNGSEFLGTSGTAGYYPTEFFMNYSGIINLNGSSDYVEVYLKSETQNATIETSQIQTTSGTSTTAHFVRLT